MKKKVLGIIAGLLFGGVGAAFGYAVAANFLRDFISDTGYGWYAGVYVFALVPVGYVLSIAFHEAGHAVAGWLQGYKLFFWSANIFKVERIADGTLRFGFNFDTNPSGGLTLMLPDEGQPFTNSAFVAIVLGGPLASLLLAAFALSAYVAPLEFWMSSPELRLASAPFFITGLISGGIFLMTAIPFRAGPMFMSDGIQAISLFRGDRLALLRQRILAVFVHFSSGKRPAELDESIIAEIVEADEHPLMGISAHTCRYYHAMDTGDETAARESVRYILRHLEDYPKSFRAELDAEMAFALILLENDYERAKPLILRSEQVVEKRKSYALSTRLQAVKAYAEGDLEKARRLVEKGLAELAGKTGTVGEQRLAVGFARDLLKRIPVLAERA